MVNFTTFAKSIRYKNVYSQFGEDGIIERIFEKIGTANKWCFECGATDGVFFSNTRRLVEQGWQAVLVEADKKHFDRLLKLCDPDGEAVGLWLSGDLGERFTTPQFALWRCNAMPEGETSVDAILKASYAPTDIDLVVIDIDGQDYHLFNTLVEYQPRVVICEYDPNEDVDFIPTIGGQGQAGERAIHHVALARGYQVVCKTWCNLICVRNDLCHLLLDEQPNRLESLGAMTPVLDEAAAIIRKWEVSTNAFLEKARGVVHIGANSGQERDLYKALGLPVIWVEALPDVFQELLKNVRGYSGQLAYNYLLTDENYKEYDFGIANNDGQSSSIFEFADSKQIWPEVGYTDSIKLRSTRFDTMVVEESLSLDGYDALIMDVQGAELLVLKGAGDLLDGFRFIRAECADFEIYKDCCQLKDLDEYLLSRGFTRVQTWRAAGKPELGYTYEALYVRHASDDPLIGGYTQEELIEAKRQREEEGNFMLAACMSTGRWGPISTMDVIQSALTPLGSPLFRDEGAYWHHQLTTAIERALKVHPDAIMTFDYDSLFCPTPQASDIAKLVTLMLENPDVDVIIPLQMQRESGFLIAATEDGELTLSQPLAPVWFGHFGMTIFRTSVFDRLKKPWFWEKCDPNGGWGEGRVDADSGFWLNCKESGIKVCMATDVVLGHGEYGPTFPDDNFKPIKMSLNDWRKNGMRPPANAFNRQRVIEAALAGTSPIAKVQKVDQ